MKVSVIVNISKNPLHLYLCLKSLNKQTFKQFEVILINQNNSKIISNIIKNFMNSFNNAVILIQDKFSSHGSALNAGIKTATGEYIKFLNTWESLQKDALELMYKEAKNHNSSCVISRGYKQILWFRKEERFNLNTYELPILGNKLFQKEILKNNLFKEGVNDEYLSNIPIILSKNNVNIIGYNLYNYKCHFTNFLKIFNKRDEAILDIIIVLDSIKEKMDIQDFNNTAILYILLRLENMFYSKNNNQDIKKILIDYLYNVDDQWQEYEIIKIYQEKNRLFNYFINHSNL